MASIVYAPNASANLERAFAVLAHRPFVGRVVEDELRELVISFGRTGYVALYRFVPARDEIRVVAIRHQRELGYSGS